MRGVVWFGLALSASLAMAPPATAQVMLPIDVHQGALVNTDGGAPYIAALRFQVALGLGAGAPLRVGPVAAVRYANPEWVAAAVARVQWLAWRFGLGGRRWGVGLTAEHLVAPHDRDLTSGGLILDLELLRLGLLGVHERESGRTGFELGIGTDLRSVHAVLFPRPDRDPFPDID